MYKLCAYGFIFLGFIGVSFTHILTPKNDWVPISKDEVLRRLYRLNRRNADISHFHPIKNEADTYNNEDVTKSTIPNNFYVSNSETIYKNNAMNLVQPVKVMQLDQANVLYPVAPDTITSVNDLQSFIDENHEQAELRKKETTTSQEFRYFAKSVKNDDNFRKPKVIEVSHYTNNIENGNGSSSENIEKEKEKTEKVSSYAIANENRKIYQVTEDAIDTIEEEQSKTEERTGYFYTPPKPNHGNSMGNNLTEIFLDILSKHNIQPGDNLQNYFLSRRQKNQNPPNRFMLIPIPLTVFSQFNNWKLDPLAVLLSNYGYYLPDSYGIRGKYRNLYGYLASNNIHNNQPFGSYKIFSDTDSSN